MLNECDREASFWEVTDPHPVGGPQTKKKSFFEPFAYSAFVFRRNINRHNGIGCYLNIITKKSVTH